MRCLFALSVWCLAGEALAGSCGYYQPYYAQPYVVKQVIREIPVYVAAFVPVVSVGYAAPVAAAIAQPVQQQAMPQALQAEPCADLKQRLDRLERLLSGNVVNPAQQAGQPTVLQSQAPQTGAWAVLASRCAECHTEGASMKGKFALFGADSRPVKLTAEQKLKVLAVTKGKAGQAPTMPKAPGKPLTDEEYAKLLDLLDES
jgi:uncharacterized membrane protein